MPSTKNKTNRIRKARREGILEPNADDLSLRAQMSGVMDERTEAIPAELPTSRMRRTPPLSTKRKTKRAKKKTTGTRRTTPTTQRGARKTASRRRAGAGSKRKTSKTRR